MFCSNLYSSTYYYYCSFSGIFNYIKFVCANLIQYRSIPCVLSNFVGFVSFVIYIKLSGILCVKYHKFKYELDSFWITTIMQFRITLSTMDGPFAAFEYELATDDPSYASYGNWSRRRIKLERLYHVTLTRFGLQSFLKLLECYKLQYNFEIITTIF